MKSMKEAIDNYFLVKRKNDLALQEANKQLYDFVKENLADCGLLNEAIIKLENSNKYILEYNDIQVWERFDSEDIMPIEFKDQKELFNDMLSDFLSEDYISYNDIEKVITTSHGPSIIINEDGDVFDQDSGKCIIKSSDYEYEEDRNRLIEAYMNHHGYFPGVYEVDRHNNVTHVNTISE